MAKPGIEIFIARRIGGGSQGGPGAESGHSGGSSGRVMVRIATATAAVSMAVMIVAVAVITGFRSEISDKIAAFAGHVRIQSLDYGGGIETDPITTDSLISDDVSRLDHFRSLQPYALKGGLLRTDEATQGVVLKGVGAGYDLSFFAECLSDGALPRIGGETRHKDILISASVARMLRLGVDDRVEILFTGSAAGPESDPGARLPRRDLFRVSGIYSSGLGEMDNRFVLTDISNVRRLNGWTPAQITGYEITIDDIDRLPEFEAAAWNVVKKHDTPERKLAVRSVVGDYPQLFDWLATHNVNAAVIITIMVAVALISMISALLIILLERIRMIGILKTLGMSSGRIRRVFVIRSGRILIWGLFWGNLTGIGLSLLQRWSGWVRLDSDGYFLSSVPIELNVWWIALLNVGTFVVILALLVFPTAVIGRVSPDKSIRYQ